MSGHLKCINLHIFIRSIFTAYKETNLFAYGINKSETVNRLNF